MQGEASRWQQPAATVTAHGAKRDLKLKYGDIFGSMWTGVWCHRLYLATVPTQPEETQRWSEEK